MKKWNILQRVLQNRAVAVLRGDSAEQVELFAEKCIEGGLKALEITMTTPGALGVIERLAAKYRGDAEIVVGVGSVLDAETARLAILAGAEFVVTPFLQKEVVTVGHRYQIPVLPGATTVKEVAEGLEVGADLIKVFPGEIVGPGFLKAVKGPIPHANLMPTGGVNLENAHTWFAAGAVCVGIGSDLTKEAVMTGNADLVREKARAYVEVVRGVK